MSSKMDHAVEIFIVANTNKILHHIEFGLFNLWPSLYLTLHIAKSK